jgi:hypothetical protein
MAWQRLGTTRKNDAPIAVAARVRRADFILRGVLPLDARTPDGDVQLGRVSLADPGGAVSS